MASDDPAPSRLGVLAALASGDAALAFRIVLDLMAEGRTVEEVLLDVLTPVGHEVGDRWSAGDLGVADEHVATAALETVVAMLAGVVEPPEGADHVVVVCAEGELHALSARVAAVVLTERGHRVTYLGASLPADALEEYLRVVPADALLVSCSLATALPGARRTVAAAHAAGVPVLAGGRAFGTDGERARAVGADGWAPDPADADRLLRSWAPEPAVREAEVPEPGPDQVALERGAPGWVEAALARLTATLDGAVAHPRLRDELHLLVAALEADVVAPGVLDEFRTWQATTLRAQGVGPDDLADRLARALAAVIAPDVPALASRVGPPA